MQNLHKDVEIKAANGKALRAVTVFAHALKFFKDHVLEELSDQSATKILEEDIQWVLTVPAIWKAPAKQFMRTAAYEVSPLDVSYCRMRMCLRSLRLAETLPMMPTIGEPFKLNLDVIELFTNPT